MVDGLDAIPWFSHGSYSVSKEIAYSIIYLNSTEAMWKYLKERFTQGNGPKIISTSQDCILFNRRKYECKQLLLSAQRFVAWT